MAEQPEVPVFEPTYLFLVDAQGQQKTAIAQSQEEHDALTAAGWKKSPAEFGIETAPAMPVYTMAPEPQPMSTAPGELMQEVLRLVGAMEHELKLMANRLDALEALATQPAPSAPTEQHVQMVHERGRRG